MNKHDNIKIFPYYRIKTPILLQRHLKGEGVCGKTRVNTPNSIKHLINYITDTGL